MPTVDLTLALLARAAADNNDAKPTNNTDYSDITCPKPLPQLVGTGEPLFGPKSPNFHTFSIYLAGGALALTLLSSLWLNFRHLRRYTSPQEQRQILRVINLPLAYSIFNFLALTFTLDYMYIEPIGQIYEAFAVAALFLLLLEYVAPDGTDRDAFFAATENRGRGGKVIPGGSLQWYKNAYAEALQYPLLKTILIIIQIVTQYFGDYCESSFSPKHAHLWLTLADYLFVGGALGATIRFSMRFRNEYPPGTRARQKVWTFLGIIIFQILQDLIFHLLNGKLFKPSAKLTYNDLNFGMASLLTCVESLIFSLIMQWSFSATNYSEGTKQDRYGGNAKRVSTFRAIFDALNLADIVAGTFVALGSLVARLSQRFGGKRRQQQPMGMEPLAGGVGGGYHPGYQGGRAKMGSPEWEDSESRETSYVAGYHAPPMPPAARDPSPGREQMVGSGMYGSYGNGAYGGAVSEETMPLREPRGMV